MVAKTATAPLERIKMLSQTGEGGRGPVAIARTILRTEGVAGMFAGNGANLLRVFPAKGVVYTANDVYKMGIMGVGGYGEGEKAPVVVSE